MRRATLTLWVFGIVGTLALGSRDARADGSAKTLDDYRYFRALHIDLVGRIPAKDELTDFEAPGFDLEGWIDQHLTGDAYVDRVRRIYMDALRLEVSTNFTFTPPSIMLRRYPVQVKELDGSLKTEWVYWRVNQLRETAALNRAFCFGQADTGQTYLRNRAPDPALPSKSVPRATFNQRVARVKPWWLYRDYRAATPTDHYSSWGANGRFRLELPNDPSGAAKAANDVRLLVGYDGATTTDVAVCKEEASTASTVSAVLRGQTVDLACTNDIGALSSKGCGCGKGLEWCSPGAGFSSDPRAMVLPTADPLGPDAAFEVERRPQSDWWRAAWNEEARQFLAMLVDQDRDFREVVTARDGRMNGPLAQFYRAAATSDTADQLSLGSGATYAHPESIVDPTKIPADLLPYEMDRWVSVADRGPRAAGILTTTAFLAKYASRRGRAHAVYNTFLCRDFVAENLKLDPSNEANLMIRPGCSTCHATLEPLAAYFTRTKENSFAWIAAPIDNPLCTFAADGGGTTACNRFYDPSFSSTSAGKLRGAYGDPTHVDRGPAGLGAYVASLPEFSSCVTQTVTESLLGRKTTTPDDETLLRGLNETFMSGGHKMRALVRALVKSDAYRHANSVRPEGSGK